MIILSVLLVAFYYYFKAMIFRYAPIIAQNTTLIQRYPYSQVVGTIELCIVAACHAIFCLFLLKVFDIDIKIIFKQTTLLDCVYGGLIGVGCLGVSVLFCTTAIKFVELFSKNNKTYTLQDWSVIANSGWIRHHKHTIKILPGLVALIIITLQIGSEEIIYRVILMQVFSPLGIIAAFTLSTIFFVAMQRLHMPSNLSAMFPMIGASVMGVTHSLLYLYQPLIIPLIISHITFFVFTMI